MSTFAEKMAAARAARPTIDVPILLLGELVAEKARLEAIIAADDGDARLSGKSPADEAREALDLLAEQAGEGMITLRVTQLPGEAWGEIAARHLPRVGNAVDESYGFNFDAATDDAVTFVDKSGKAYGVRLEGDEEVPLTADEYAELRETISGHELTQIRNGVWGLNVFLPRKKLETLGKAFGAAARSEKN